jgi:hypothetical protein
MRLGHLDEKLQHSLMEKNPADPRIFHVNLDVRGQEEAGRVKMGEHFACHCMGSAPQKRPAQTGRMTPLAISPA